jgi:DNA-binding MarR family transcriptional regulator
VSEVSGLEEQVVMAVRRITRAVDVRSRELFQQFGLTTPQLVTLQAIAREGQSSISRLARTIHLSQATLTGVLERLASRGLIARERSEDDRRAIRIALTPQGNQLLDGMPSLLHDQFRLEFLQLPQWEQTQVVATLQRLATMMESQESAFPEED